MQNEDDIKQLWAKLVAKSWEDANLRQRMLDEPAAVLKENGVQVPAGFRVHTFEDDGQTIVLPVNVEPAETELSEEELESVAGGVEVIANPTIGALKGFESLLVIGPCDGPREGMGPCARPKSGKTGAIGPCF